MNIVAGAVCSGRFLSFKATAYGMMPTGNGV